MTFINNINDHQIRSGKFDQDQRKQNRNSEYEPTPILCKLQVSLEVIKRDFLKITLTLIIMTENEKQ